VRCGHAARPFVSSSAKKPFSRKQIIANPILSILLVLSKNFPREKSVLIGVNPSLYKNSILPKTENPGSLLYPVSSRLLIMHQ